MRAKKLFITTAVIGALAVPTAVFAATADTQAIKHFRGLFGLDTTKLTDTQKADVSNYTQKMADLQKEFINKMVANGSMTKEQGDAAIGDIDNALKNGTYSPAGMGKGFGDRGKHDGLQVFKIDMSKLTVDQKTDLENSFKKIAELQKELVDKQVAGGLITKAQGDAAIKKIDESLADGNYLFGMEKCGFELYRIFGIDQSKLTDQQKADIKDYSEKIAAIQKEIISKEVEFGLLTKDQGDAASQRIDNMATNNFQFGSMKGMERGKGMKDQGMKRHGPRGNFKKGSDTTSTPTSAPAAPET